MQNETQCIQEDTIDLRELWAVLVRRKKLIWGVTAVVMLLALVYAFTAKPVYQGSALVEIGEVINPTEVVFNNKPSKSDITPTTIFYLDNPNTLKDIISTAKQVNAEVPKKTDNLVQLTYDSTNKDTIVPHLKSAIDYIMKRHQTKAEHYRYKGAKVLMTSVVGEISVGNEPIKPKKKLIVVLAFITGLMLSIFLAFFLEFIKGMKNDDG